MFADTSGLLCIMDNADFRHAEVSRFYKRAKQLIITNYIIAEFVPLAQTRGLFRPDILEFVLDLYNVPRLELIWVDENLHHRAFELLQKRLDKTYSLCDAVSFIVMREREMAEALTTDKHFEQEGFIKLLES